jgi:hypothetical protein
MYALLIIYSNENRPIVQIYMAIYASSIFFLYLVMSVPYEDRLERFLANFTEACLIAFIQTVLFFTSAVEDPYAKYSVGWFTMNIFFVNLVAHLCALVYTSIREMIQKLRKLKHDCKTKPCCWFFRK